TLIHIQRRLVALRAAHYLGRYAGDSGVRGYRVDHHAAGTYLGTHPHFDIAEHLGARPYHDPFADLGMAIAALLAGPSQGHALQDGDIVFNHSGFTDHYAGGMVKHDALADPCSRVHVDPE